ncbi:MAG: hypothetical protein ACKVP0_16315 [Pirellulaceae bacterium]
MKTLCSLAILFSACGIAFSDEGEKYTLAYKFTSGEEVRTRVVQQSTVDTKIKGAVSIAKSRSVSTKVWKITAVDGQGNITLENSVADVDMWQNVTGKPEIKYNSRTDKSPPLGYQYVADSIGKPLATLTISPSGKLMDRHGDAPQLNTGLGDITVPLPEGPVKEGDTWETPEDIRLKIDDVNLTIKVRQFYRLVQVRTGVATISVETQVLTPVRDPKVLSQLVQRMQKGTIKFDVDAGRLLHRQMDLDESILGFSGPESHMNYLSRTTEEPVENGTTGKTAQK